MGEVSKSSGRLRVAFVDDHPILLAGMSAMFSEEPDFAVAATGANAADALAICRTHRPDLLFMDLSMPGDVFSAVSEISRDYSSTKTIVLTAFSSVDSALRALDAGATGFVLKGCSFDELFEAVEAVLRGELYVAKQYASQVFAGLRHRKAREDALQSIRLSVREKQIVQHLMLARTNREIAASLSISEKTVKNYMTGLMDKLHARNRLEVAIAAKTYLD